MVYVNGLKYACATCVKGHRSSACLHSDRPLYEIKKKGRPITQCQHCRELRKTKQVHVKCMCSDKIKKENGSSDLPNGLSDLSQPRIQIPSPPEEMIPLPYSGSANMSRNSSQNSQCPSGVSCNCAASNFDQVIVKREPGALLTPPLEKADISQCSCSHQKTVASCGSDSDESIHDRLPLVAPRPLYPLLPVSEPHDQASPQSHPTPPSANGHLPYSSWDSHPEVKMEETKVELVELESPCHHDSFCSEASQTQLDDIDNDTPTFVPNELDGDNRREETLLGALSGTSSEDLMHIIYSSFSSPSKSQGTNLPTEAPTCNSCNAGSIEGLSIYNGSMSVFENGKSKSLTVDEARRLVTCRCGDGCACAGCLVHPREVMRNVQVDPYAGYDGFMDGVEFDRDTIDPNAQSTIMNDEGTPLCGCGCSKPSDQCRNCAEVFCEDYILRNSQ